MSSNLVLWDPGKAAQVGNLKGQMTGYIAGVYSMPGMANIAAAPTEVLNQNGYNVYTDTNTGLYHIIQDNYPNNENIWTSQTLGVTLDCTGDTLELKGINETGDDSKKDDKGGGTSPTGTVNASPFGLVTASPASYQEYGNSARSNFAASVSSIMNRSDAAASSGVSYASTYGLKTDETIDPVTKAVVDKTKSSEIDEMLTSEATKHKFDNIAKLVNKVAEKQSKAELEAVDKSGDYATTAGVVGAAVGAGCAIKGAAAGAAVGSAVPVVGTLIGAGVGALVGIATGWVAGKVVKACDESKADKVNNEAAKEAQQAGAELKEALEGLSEEELIAFQRYYQKTQGRQLTSDLKCLETDDDSSKIAQGAGFDSGYLTGVFTDIDSANETLKPDETDVNAEVATSNATEISYAQAAEINILQQDINILNQCRQKAIQNGGTAELYGTTMTIDEINQKYVEACQKYDDYLAEIKSPGVTLEA